MNDFNQREGLFRKDNDLQSFSRNSILGLLESLYGKQYLEYRNFGLNVPIA